MSKSTLPCRKATNGVYASRYLKRAERLAKSITSKYGKKTNIIDGCIVQGAKANKTISASSIELPSEVLAVVSCGVPSYTIAGRLRGRYIVPNRDPFHPLQVSKMGADSFSKYRLDGISYKGVGFGHSFTDFGNFSYFRADPYNLIPSVKNHAGRFFHYSPAYRSPDFDPERPYMSIFMDPMLSGLPKLHVSFHDDYIKAATGGYSIANSEMNIQNMSSQLVEVGYGVFAIVFAVGKNIYQQADPTAAGYYMRAKYETRLLLAVVDLRLGESEGDDDSEAKADLFLFPEELIPENMRPTSVMVDGENSTVLTVPAPSIMTIQDLGLDENGNILAAIKYQVKVQSNDRVYAYQGGGVSPRMYKGHEGTGVMAFGLASWGHQGSYFNVHSLEVVEGIEHDELISRFGVSPSEAMFGDRQVLIGGDVYRWGIPVSRRTADIFAMATISDYQMLPPYVVELKNGVPTGNNALNGPTDLLAVGKELYFGYGASIDFERDFHLNNDWIRASLSGEKALVSDSCYVIPAGENIETATSSWGYTIRFAVTSAGIMFMDGDKRKFEGISELSGAHESYGMTVSCHQREVRDGNGKLVMPSALIVCAYKGDRPKMFIRKGPIWPEDFAEDEDPSDYSELWTEVETSFSADHYAKYVYTGNQLMANKHGEIFQ